MICTAHNHVQLDEHVSEIIYYTMLGISYIVIHINIISIMGPGAARTAMYLVLYSWGFVQYLYSI